MATSGKFSGRVEVSHYTLGGLPDVDHRFPYFCPVECNIGRRARRHESGTVLAALGADLWAIPAQSGRRLPGAGRRGGLPAEAVRRSGAALAYGRWAIQTLVQAWHQVVEQEGCWHAHREAGFRPVACDVVGFFRPRLSGCLGTHDHSGADKALPAIVLAVVAAVGSVGKVRLPLVRLRLRAEPSDRSDAALQRRAITQAGAA